MRTDLPGAACVQLSIEIGRQEICDVLAILRNLHGHFLHPLSRQAEHAAHAGHGSGGFSPSQSAPLEPSLPPDRKVPGQRSALTPRGGRERGGEKPRLTHRAPRSPGRTLPAPDRAQADPPTLKYQPQAIGADAACYAPGDELSRSARSARLSAPQSCAHSSRPLPTYPEAAPPPDHNRG